MVRNRALSGVAEFPPPERSRRGRRMESKGAGFITTGFRLRSTLCTAQLSISISLLNNSKFLSPSVACPDSSGLCGGMSISALRANDNPAKRIFHAVGLATGVI